jgi:hypothetical protein
MNHHQTSKVLQMPAKGCEHKAKKHAFSQTQRNGDQINKEETKQLPSIS